MAGSWLCMEFVCVCVYVCVCVCVCVGRLLYGSAYIPLLALSAQKAELLLFSMLVVAGRWVLMPTEAYPVGEIGVERFWGLKRGCG